jgi:hypothetical protein
LAGVPEQGPKREADLVGLKLSDRGVLAGLALGVSGLALSGCMSSPTYGTDKTANMQLLEDVSGMMKFGDKQAEPIQYAPRPELVKPGEQVALVAPQDELATASNPAWPESPEQRRARIKAEATANQGDSTYRAPVIVDTVSTGPKKIGKIQNGREPVGGPGYDENFPSPDQRTVHTMRKVDVAQGAPTSRKYLSEPPLDYRAPEATAPVGDTGEDEWKKERRVKRQASKKRSFKDILPW